MALPLAALAVGGGLAGLGALGSWFGGRNDAEMLSDAYDRVSGMANDAVAANSKDINSYASMLNDTYGAGAANYAQALQDFLNSPVYQNKEFEYGKGINEFLDPALNQRMDAVMNAVNNAGATGGNRFSSDYMNRLQSRVAATQSEEWEKAYQRLMQDRQQAMNEYSTNATNAWNNYNASQDRLNAAVNAYGADRENLMNGMGDVTMANMNNRLGGLNTQAQTIMGKAQANQGTGAWDLVGNIGNAGAAFLGNYFGGK